MWSWGPNGQGEVGNGTTVTAKTAVHVSGISDVIAVAAGLNHTLALKSDGTVWSWGRNANGELGIGTTTPSTVPVQVPGLSGIVAIAAGEQHSVALAGGGTVWTWGKGLDGQLGDGGSTDRTSPYAVSLPNVVRIGAGSRHTLAVTTGGVWAWGRNSTGQIGDGTTTVRRTPVAAAGLGGDVVSVAGGATFTLALRLDGTVWAWGQNNSGQLGLGTVVTPQTTPVQVTALDGIVSIAAGETHALAAKGDGTLWAWGVNTNGQLGDGSVVSPQTLPVQTSGLAGVVNVAAGNGYSLAVTANNEVWGWGLNSSYQLGDGTAVQRLTPVMLAEAGYVWKAGTPTFNTAAGTYTTTRNVTISTATAGATIRYTTDGSDPTPSSTQYTTAVAVTQSLTLRARAWATGMGSSNIASAAYQLKVATPTATPPGGGYIAPQTVTLATTSPGVTLRYTSDGTDPVVDSTAYTGPIGIGTSLNLKVRGFRAGWTDSDVLTQTYAMDFGTLPAPTLSPAPGTYPTSVDVSMSSIPDAVIRYTTDGTDPTPSSDLYASPVPVTASATVKARAYHIDYSDGLVASHAYVIKTETPVMTPAGGTYLIPQLVVPASATPGSVIHYTVDGAEPTESHPSLIPGQTLRIERLVTLKAKAFTPGTEPSDTATASYQVLYSLAARSTHSVLLSTDGRVWGWGPNGSGEIGDGTTSTRMTAVEVPGLTDAVAVAAGLTYTLALKSDGTVWAWGANVNGQLGTGTTTPSNVPVQVVGLTGVVAIAAGDRHSVALTGDGTVWTWGHGAYGQLGDGGSADRTMPFAVTLPGVLRIAAGGRHTLAVTTTGVWAWGRNNSGQLGDGTTASKSTPAAVVGLSGDVVAVAGGADFSLGLKADGTVWGWGLNSSGQLGIGSLVTPKTTPIQATSLAGVVAIAAGSSHALAVLGDGTVRGWGLNANGQLGDGSLVSPQTSPIPIAGLSGVVAVAGGSTHSLAVTTSTEVWGWGVNSSYQLGDGTTVQRLTPIVLAEAGYLWKTGTPTANIAAGTYTTTKTVTISTVTTGSTIRYTTDGSDPTTSSTQYTSPVAVTQSLTIKARAWATSKAPSNLMSRAYELKVATPTATPPGGSYTASQTVTLATTSPGVTLRYTTDGSDPLPTSPAYSAPIPIGTTLTLKVLGFRSGWTTSDLVTHSYAMDFGTLAAPTLLPEAGTYVTSLDVTMSSIAGADIRYTTDGSDPTTSSALYTSPVTLAASTTIKARAYHVDYSDGLVATNAYTVKTAAPVADPAAGTYSAPQTVTLATATTEATIRYTTDGSDPIDTSPVYSEPVPVAQTTTLKARAWSPGREPSDVASASYVLEVAAPILTPGGGLFSAPQTVSASTSSPGAILRYTTDGTDPGAASTLYTGPIEFDLPATLKVRGFRAGWTDSAVSAATYSFKAATPVAAPAGGTYTSPQTVTLTTSSPDTTLRYTTDGTDPGPASPIYAGPINVPTTTVLKARAFRSGWSDSDVLASTYVMNFGTLPAPAFDPLPGTYSTAIDVTMSSISGATIRYTTDGSDPTPASPLYTAALHITTPKTLKARAFHIDYPDSLIATGVYTVQIPEPVAWTAIVGAVVVSGDLVKMAANGWNAGAASTKSLVSGDGYLEVIAGETNTNRVLGLSEGDSDQTHGDVDFAIALNDTGRIAIYEAGTYRGEFGSYVTGDRLRVAVEGGLVRYRHEGNLLYTSTVAARYPLSADTALYDSGATVMDAVIAGELAENVLWTGVVGVTSSLGAFTKPLATPTQAGAASTRGLISGDGYLEVTAQETNTSRLFGLSQNDTDQSYADVDFGIELTDAGRIVVQENGVSRGDFGPYATGDKLRVAVEGGVVRYRHAGGLIYTSGVAPAYPMRADTSAVSAGAQVRGAVLFGLLGDEDGPPPPNPTNQPPVVNAGADQAVTLPSAATLAGTVSDDGLPNASITLSWSKVAGPGSVTFGSPSALTTTATFSIKGAYVLRLTADDGALSSSDDVGVIVSGSGSVLLVVGNTALSAGDTLLRDRIIAQGFTVAVILAASSTSADANGRDLVWVSNSCPNGDVLAKFRNVAVPVVVQAIGIYDDMGLTDGAGRGSTSGTTVNVMTPDHPIASGLSGEVTVCPATCGISWGTPSAAGTRILATTSSAVQSPLFVYASGASMVGLSAPARRGAFGISPDSLSPTGTTLLDALVRWMTQTNLGPVVDAGPDVSVNLGATVSLAGSAVDDGLPAPPILTTTWSKASGPGSVTFVNPSLLNTMAFFTTAGTHFLRLTASDGAVSSSDLMAVHVLPVPNGDDGGVTFTPPPGTYVGGQRVQLVSSWTTATIRYTTDGSEPTASSTAYTGPVTVWGDITLKAKAFRAGASTATSAAAYQLLFDRAALFVTSGSTPPGADDASVRDRLALLGLRPVMIAYNQVQQADASGKALVAISNTVGAFAVDMFKGAIVPVMAWEPFQFPALALTGSVQDTDHGTTAGQQVAIADPAHPIAAGLTGNPTIASPTGSLAWGVPGASAMTVATLVGTPARAVCFAYEARSDMVGFVAPARRVGFMGSAGSYTLEGWRLFDAAVRWATGALPTVLFVTGEGTLHPGDAATRDRLSRRGYPVRVRTDGAVQASEAANVAAVLISSTTDFNAVGSKFRDVLVPVMTWQPSLQADMGMGTSEGVSVGQTAVTIQDPAHPMAAGLTGTVTIATTPTQFAWGSSPPAAAIKVATTSGSTSQWTVYGYDYGAAMAGLTAPSRRLVFPTTAGLTTQGWALFDAAFDWLVSGDADGDGLSDIEELRLGTDHRDTDTNDDGLDDQLEVGVGKDPVSTDVDRDGLTNDVEIALGTDPFTADTDGDGVIDGQDAFPLDPTRWTAPPPVPGDTTPPTITLLEPTNATLISVIPPIP